MTVLYIILLFSIMTIGIEDIIKELYQNKISLRLYFSTIQEFYHENAIPYFCLDKEATNRYIWF